MSVREQVANWRAKRKMKTGGWTQVTTWIKEKDADYLPKIFQMVAGTVWDKDDPKTWIAERNAKEYQSIVLSWLDRQRPVRRKFNAIDSTVEIDAPLVGKWYTFAPVGGRIMNGYTTRIELTPEQASIVEDRCNRAIRDVVTEWLEENNLNDCIKDDTGVVTSHNQINIESDGANRFGNICRDDPDAFAENEIRIENEFLTSVSESHKHPTNNPDVLYHQRGIGIPARCFLVTEYASDKLYVALGHIRYGGTSPTNAFEWIASDLLKTRFKNEDPEKIIWLDACLHFQHQDMARFSKVEMTLDQQMNYQWPRWSEPDEVPENLMRRMTANILEDEAYHNKSKA